MPDDGHNQQNKSYKWVSIKYHSRQSLTPFPLLPNHTVDAPEYQMPCTLEPEKKPSITAPTHHSHPSPLSLYSPFHPSAPPLYHSLLLYPPPPHHHSRPKQTPSSARHPTVGLYLALAVSVHLARDPRSAGTRRVPCDRHTERSRRIGWRSKG